MNRPSYNMSKKFKIALFCVLSLGISNPIFADINVNEVNKKFGINFLQDANLWDDSATDYIKRMGAKFSSTKVGSKTIHTTYAKGKVLGSEIEQMRVEETSSKVSQVDLVFFNKGDSVEGKKWTPQLQRKMKEQWDTLEESLNTLAGKSKNGYWGTGRVKNKAKIWKNQNFAFWLEFKPREFIILHITPPNATGENTQKSVSVTNFDGKTNVKKDGNGDIYIQNIPMVDQGAKGYCVPATIERVLKYYNIADVDMHKIAAVCKTQVGGGTTIDSVMTDFRNVSNSFKLRMANVGSFSMNAIAAMIDKGIPIFWTLFSTDEYTKRMLDNSQLRSKEDFNDYMKILKKQDKLSRKLENAHICLIIGYNKKSKELAVSNSWGEKFTITWVRFADAKTVGRNCFVINPR